MEPKRKTAAAEVKDWKDRLLDEYKELKERYEKLRKHNIKNRVEFKDVDLIRPISCLSAEERRVAHYQRRSSELLENQEAVMESYIRILEERMTLEGIDY